MKIYGLFGLAMGLTALGVFLGALYAPMLFRSGVHFILLIVEIVLILGAPYWMEKSPLNILLFGLFPLFSGITIAPYLLYVATVVPNGSAILLNALLATVFMSSAAAVFARTTSLQLQSLGRFLLFGVLGLIGLGLLQLFVPALRQSMGFEMGLSAAGIVIFAAFTAFDVQRIAQMGRAGANPFLLALSLYLDIFNLFLYILRFMMALSGNRR
jgi:FtsH-binding integral membrane protein